MANTSATGGPLTPQVPPGPTILEGTALQDFFQGWLVGVTGLPGSLFRPRWQPEPPNIPPVNTDWAAFGIVSRKSDVFAAEFPDPSNPGYNVIRRHQILHILVSFYGPNADMYADILNDGLQVAQNLELLSQNSMGLVESGDITTVPELVKQKWLYRVDLPFSVRRQLVRDYGVETIQSAQVTLNNEIYTEQINTP